MAIAVQCTEVSAQCPVQASIYGYYPSLVGNIIFFVLFVVLLIAQALLGWKFKTWSFMIAMGVGCLLEAFGYIGRLLLSNNPFNGAGFKVQIVCLTIAPAFLAAGIYVQLRNLILTFGSSFSRLRPHWYTYIFISCDVVSILLQGAGGGVAASGNNIDFGNNLMIAGLVFQVFTLLIFFVLSMEYFVRAHHHRNEFNGATAVLRHSRRFKAFIGALCLAFNTIFIRCTYRVAEMAGGWGNPIMQDQTDFIACDSLMISIAAIALTICHPGWCFSSSVVGSFKPMQPPLPDPGVETDVELLVSPKMTTRR